MTRTALVTALAVSAAVATLARAQSDGARDPNRPTPMVTITGRTVDETHEARGGVSSTVGGAGHRTRLSAGSRGQTPCGMAAGATGFLPPSDLSWEFAANIVSADADHARVELAWSRHAAGALASVGSFEQRTRLTLREGEEKVLDFVRFPAAMSSDCSAALVQAHLTFVEWAEVSQAALDYDVWLVHRTAAGAEHSERVSARGRQGAKLDFVFAPLRFDGRGRSSADGELTLQVHGQISGRARRDGRIDLSLEVGRSTSAAQLALGELGFKAATVADGETVDFEPPPMRGTIPAVGELGEVFKGHQTSVRITARRAF